MPRYGHRFDTETIARWFVEYVSSYKWLSGHLVRSGRVVGVDDELAAEFDNEAATAFVTMTNAFDAGVTLALRELLGVIEAHDICTESCDRDGNTYCDCLERAIKKLKAK